MIYKLISSIAVKGFNAITSFLIVIISAQFLGAEGRGEISLFMANLTLIQLANNVITGPAMVYTVPRVPLFQLTILSTIWTILASSLFYGILLLMPFNSNQTSVHLWILSVLFGLFSANLKIIQGKEKIQLVNFLTMVQLSILVISIFLLLNHRSEFNSYIIGLYVSYGSTFILSCIPVFLLLPNYDLSDSKNTFKIVFKKGAIAQTGNILNFLNARIAYYILTFYYADNNYSLGIFALAVALSESILLVSYGIATVQYPLIANSTSKEYSINATVLLSKYCFWIATILNLVLIFTPTEIYSYLFGKDFEPVKTLIIYLSPGVILMAIANIYWNYFSGIGQFKTNNLAELTGLFCTMVFCFYFIKLYGIKGAAISSSLTYFGTSLFMFYQFYKVADKKLIELLPSLSDFATITKRRL